MLLSPVPSRAHTSDWASSWLTPTKRHRHCTRISILDGKTEKNLLNHLRQKGLICCGRWLVQLVHYISLFKSSSYLPPTVFFITRGTHGYSAQIMQKVNIEHYLSCLFFAVGCIDTSMHLEHWHFPCCQFISLSQQKQSVLSRQQRDNWVRQEFSLPILPVLYCRFF